MLLYSPKQVALTFHYCASRILKNFGMTRRGPFYGDNLNDTLYRCWEAVNENVREIRRSVRNNGLLQGRYLLELNKQERERLITEIWRITKRLLPFTMGETSYGLVGASKILFSVLPEIVLPVDNTEWRRVFKTVNMGDVIRRMAFDCQTWEEKTGKRLTDLDPSKRLTTIPAVYNVMTMEARSRF